MLRKHFVCVEMTELVTKDLIEDPRDVALLEKYDRELGKMPLHMRASLQGGEREVFFTPDGKLVRAILSLHCGDEKGSMRNGYRMVGQFGCADRSKPNKAVARFFDVARETLVRSGIAVPGDWASLLAGTDPQVARVEREGIPVPTPRVGEVLMQAWVRADVIYYEKLVGRSLVRLPERKARCLIPSSLTKGATSTCSQELFQRVFSSCYPKGAGVLVELEPGSIGGTLRSEVTRVEGNQVHGRLHGSLSLTPRTRAERSRRKSYAPWRESRCQLVGDFSFDLGSGRFTKLRIASNNGTSRFALGGADKVQHYSLGLELVEQTKRPRRRKL